MPKPKPVDPPIAVQVQIKESLLTKLDLLLWSEVEGRVPYGARSRFINFVVAKAIEERKGVV